MIIKQFIKGFLDNNNYLLIDEKSKEAVLIDCTEENSEIDSAIKENGLKLKYILFTHGHFDHILGAKYFKSKYGCKVLMHKADQVVLDNIDIFVKELGLSGDTNPPKIDEYIDEKSKIKFGDVEISVIHTPGHTPGGVCYKIGEDILFSGDTIFFESVGRTDLFGGNFSDIKESAKKIFALDDNTKIYTGHGKATTVGHEKQFSEILNNL